MAVTHPRYQLYYIRIPGAIVLGALLSPQCLRSSSAQPAKAIDANPRNTPPTPNLPGGTHHIHMRCRFIT